MRKRAKDLLQAIAYNEREHPAICVLADFAAQNPGLEFANYGEMSSYKSEARSIQKDWQRFKHALIEAAGLQLTDQQIIDASKGAFSGRLQWNTSYWAYTVGQYFPTEYRKAAAAVVEAAIHTHKASRPPAKRQVFTIAALRELNEENGGTWFHSSNMRSFRSRIESGILTGRYFVSSEQREGERRLYTVRQFDEEGNIKTYGEFQAHATRAQALKAAQKAHEEKAVVA